jgi:acyl-homoserine-lactone acylase
VPGTFPPDEVPTLIRPDYVTNGNDSHWLSNPKEPLTGFDRIIGIEEAERTLRTRLGLIQVEDRLAGEDGLPGNRFNRKLLQRVALGNRQYAGELWRDSVVSMCESAPGGFLMGSSGPVDVSGACEPLQQWNLHDDLDSNGAILFRRFVSQVFNDFTTLPTGLQGGTTPGIETVFTTQFSVSDPVHTPSGLNTANPIVQRALADAVSDLEGAGIPLDAPLRGHQYEVRGGDKIPIHGGPGTLGVFNAINVGWDPEHDGYGDVKHGSSFIMAAQFVDGKCPVSAGTFVTYSESENQRSRHAADYTRAFSQKRWNHVPFCPNQVRRKALSTKRVVFRRR